MDGNLSNYGDKFDKGTLEGVQGTLPGAQADDAFREQLTTWYSENQNGKLEDFSYSAESYDATVLAALAAIKGNGTDGETISKNIRAVSGGQRRHRGEDVRGGRQGARGRRRHQLRRQVRHRAAQRVERPDVRFIGIYKYGADNTYTYQRQIEGKIEE